MTYDPALTTAGQADIPDRIDEDSITNTALPSLEEIFTCNYNVVAIGWYQGPVVIVAVAGSAGSRTWFWQAVAYLLAVSGKKLLLLLISIVPWSGMHAHLIKQRRPFYEIIRHHCLEMFAICCYFPESLIMHQHLGGQIVDLVTEKYADILIFLLVSKLHMKAGYHVVKQLVVLFPPGQRSAEIGVYSYGAPREVLT